MSFLSPAFLWALPLVGVPVLIHLFGRKKREVIRWGAMEFLLGSATPRRRLMRLKDLLLLLLRVAIVLAIIGGLSQPMISSSRLGSTGPRDLILVLDNSMSTGRKVGAETVFDRELTEVGRLVAQLDAGDRVRVLLTSPRPEWLATGSIAADPTHVRSLLNRLGELRPNNGTADMLDCVQRAILAAPAGKDFSRFVTVVTDGQAHGWRAETPGEWAAIQRLATKATPPVSTRVVLADAPASVSNLAIEKLTVDRVVLGIGQPATVTASVKNSGTTSTEPASLTWRSGDRSLGVSTIPSLQPVAATTVKLSQPFTVSGVAEIFCALGGKDELAADDSGQVLIEVTEGVRVLIVEGESKTDPAQSDTQYFLAALGYHQGATQLPSSTSAFQPRTIDYQRLPAENLSDFQCIVLANIPRLPTAAIQKLIRYVQTGGGLWIALGEQTDVRAFNEAFFEQGVGISPVSLLQPTGDARENAKFTAMAPPAAGHPATALLSDLQRLDMDRVKVYRRHQFSSGSGSSMPLLRAEGGAALAVEKNVGRGRVIVQAFPLGLAWSNLPLCHSFVVMVHEWLWYLTEPSLVKRNLQPGELLEISRTIGASDGIAALETPGGWDAQLIGSEEDGRLVFRYLKTQMPGEYNLKIAGTSDGGRAEKFLVARDPEESNLTPLSVPQIEALSQSGGLAFGSNPFLRPTGQQVVIPQPKAIGAWLLLGLIFVMLTEAAFAFWTARQRHVLPPEAEEHAIHA